MAVTYVFSPNTRIRSSEVNQDFADILVTEPTSWSPTIFGNSVNGAGTYVSQSGRYWQFRKQLSFQASLTISAHTGSGQIVLTLPALPTGASVGSNVFTVGYSEKIDFPAGALQLVLYAGASSQNCFMYGLRDNTTPISVDIPTAFNCRIDFNGSFEVD